MPPAVRCFAENLGHGHFDRPIVLDHDDTAGDGHFAVGEGVECIHQLFGTDALRCLEFNFDVFGGEIIDATHFQLALARRIFDGRNHRFSGCAGRDFLDHDRRVVLHLDPGAHLDGALAIA